VRLGRAISAGRAIPAGRAEQITRAIQQLQRLNLIEVSKEDVGFIITGKSNHRGTV
jgi:hypothetical protein